MKIDKNCKYCSKPFKASISEHNRGNALFCNLSCTANYKNSLISFKEELFICKHCGRDYKSFSDKSKYCSSSCKLKNYRLKKKSKFGFERFLEKEIRLYPCEICQWQEFTRDVHHILPVSKGGKSEINNLISLCPNHHVLADNNMLSQDYLFEIAKYRTISSSLESLLLKIKSKEQDANSGN